MASLSIQIHRQAIGSSKSFPTVKDSSFSISWFQVSHQRTAKFKMVAKEEKFVTFIQILYSILIHVRTSLVDTVFLSLVSFLVNPHSFLNLVSSKKAVSRIHVNPSLCVLHSNGNDVTSVKPEHTPGISCSGHTIKLRRLS